MPVYTKTGDAGETGLFGGKRVAKNDPIIEATGSVDELNSHLGIVACIVVNTPLEVLIRNLQSDLFSVGSALSGAPVDLSHLEERSKELERMIDGAEAGLPDLSNFIIPGPTRETAEIHVARSVARRAERRVVGLFQDDTATKISDADKTNIRKLLNRLSDFLFIVARSTAISAGANEMQWKGKMKA
jgi:cob(I)alamin adenosyltransferase